MKEPTILEEIKALVDEQFGFDIATNTRKQKYVFARTTYFKLCRTITRLSLEEIGKTIEKDHATVLHGVRMFDAFEKHPSQYKQHMQVYKNILDVYKSKVKHEDTLLVQLKKEKLQMQTEKKEVLKIHQEISNKYLQLKDKHNRMLKYYTKFEKDAFDKYAEL